MRILLTGKTGQLGFELQRSLSVLGELLAVGRAECDLADIAALRALVCQFKPDVIVNPAAYTAVDKAESELAQATCINTQVPEVLAEEAERLGALLVHFSTDYVFDGNKQGWYSESDLTNPGNVYGRSKRDGELLLAERHAEHLILRTSWVAGGHGANFAKTMLRLAVERDRLRVVADQWGAPTSAALLADVLAHLIRQWSIARERFPYGTYHVAAAGETNWCDYARFVLAEAERLGLFLRVGPDQVQAIASADYPVLAKRPLNSRLDTCKFRETFGLVLPHWQHGISHLVQQIVERHEK